MFSLHLHWKQLKKEKEILPFVTTCSTWRALCHVKGVKAPEERTPWSHCVRNQSDSEEQQGNGGCQGLGRGKPEALVKGTEFSQQDTVPESAWSSVPERAVLCCVRGFAKRVDLTCLYHKIIIIKWQQETLKATGMYMAKTVAMVSGCMLISKFI